VILKRVGAKWHISTPLLFCEMRCILVWRGERTPVTQQLFVSWEGRGFVTFMLMTYCWLLVLSHTCCMYVCLYGTEMQVAGSCFPFLQWVSFDSGRNFNTNNPRHVHWSGYMSIPSPLKYLRRHKGFILTKFS
jgi:hypothetical protein